MRSSILVVALTLIGGCVATPPAQMMEPDVAPEAATNSATGTQGFERTATVALTANDYPHPARGNQVDTYHGVAVADPYRALEDLDAPATRAWIEAQRASKHAPATAAASRQQCRSTSGPTC